MSVASDLADLKTSLDTATNLVAAEVTFLQSQIKNSMTDQEVADVKAGFKAVADRLTLIGSDPNNPIPAPALQKFAHP